MIKTAGELISEAQQKIQCLDVSAAKELYDRSEDVVIIDVREADSAAESKLSGSVNISRGLLEMKMPKQCPDPDTVILTHCGGGGRASLAALTLQEMGYNNVYAITARYEDIKEQFG
jgi:rhodanese-related sulfurtransferase